MNFIQTYGEHNCIKPVYVNADYIVEIKMEKGIDFCYITAYTFGAEMDVVDYTLFKCKKDSIMAKPIMLEHICDYITDSLAKGENAYVGFIYNKVARDYLTEEERCQL